MPGKLSEQEEVPWGERAGGRGKGREKKKGSRKGKREGEGRKKTVGKQRKRITSCLPE